MASRKPVIHGRDHAPGGSDPIPGATGGGIQFDTFPQDGNYLYVQADQDLGSVFASFAITSMNFTGTNGDLSDASILLRTNGGYSAGLLAEDGGTLLLAESGGGTIKIQANSDDGGVITEDACQILLTAYDGTFGVGTILINNTGVTGGGLTLRDSSGGTLLLDAVGVGGDVSIRSNSGNVQLTAPGGNVLITSLPTSSPGVTGALWNSSGTLKIS